MTSVFHRGKTPSGSRFHRGGANSQGGEREEEENPAQGRKRGKKGERLRTVSKRPRTGNWRWVKIHSMPVLRFASVSGRY